jgi:hypothetical protein
MPRIAEDRQGSAINSHLVPVAPGEKITIRYARLMPGDSFVSFSYLEKACPGEPSDTWTYIGRFFSGHPDVTPPGGFTLRPTADAQGHPDPLRPRGYGWCLRFACFGSQNIQAPGARSQSLEITPYGSKVFEVRENKEYLFQFFRLLSDKYFHTEVRILLDYGS